MASTFQDSRGVTRSIRSRVAGVGLLACLAALLAGPAAIAQTPDALPNAVELKKSIEQHYAAKIIALLAPSFRRTPAVSVEVELDLDTVRRVVEKTTNETKTTETLLTTPGESEAEERELIERFVAPVLLGEAG